jgi:hypothetical protein
VYFVHSDFLAACILGATDVLYIFLLVDTVAVTNTDKEIDNLWYIIP